jgi:hypothetical protein
MGGAKKMGSVGDEVRHELRDFRDQRRRRELQPARGARSGTPSTSMGGDNCSRVGLARSRDVRELKMSRAGRRLGSGGTEAMAFPSARAIVSFGRERRGSGEVPILTRSECAISSAVSLVFPPRLCDPLQVYCRWATIRTNRDGGHRSITGSLRRSNRDSIMGRIDRS